VAQPDVARDLRLGEGMEDGERLEFLVTQSHPAPTDLLEVDLLRRAPIDPEDDPVSAPRHDPRHRAGHTSVRDSDSNSLGRNEAYCDHGVAVGPAACEQGGGPAVCAATCERHPAADHVIDASDDVGLVAGLRVDEDQEKRVAARVVDVCDRRRCSGVPGAARID
jgi:hypothetical protein